VVIEDFINYDDLFPTVAAFVTSGGFGSSLAAFLHGVPVVGAGKREGKNDINARVGHNKLGIDLRAERPQPSAVRKAVDRVLNDPTYAEKVAALRSELLSYDPMARIEAVVTGATKDAAA
jgi:UDP:flavonoid glycosyltransferase YjiC (YdhE family)